MNLLLLLTAFFASLTGTNAGERVLCAGQGIAVVQAAEAAQAAVDPARRAIPVPATPRPDRLDRDAAPLGAQAALASAHLPFERRLE